MNLRFVKASPCRNTTVFIEDDVPLAARPAVARLAMGADVLAGEQAGFLVPPKHPESILRVEMAGGEFCGNATLSLGALAVARGLCPEGKPFLVECSGEENPVRVQAERAAAGKWHGRIELSLEVKISEAEFTVSGTAFRGAVAELPGICHFCTMAGAEPLSRETYDMLLQLLMEKTKADAYGIIPYSVNGKGEFSIRPFVAVPAAQSYVFEQACGSGSLALGHWLLHSRGISKAEILQPGGKISVEVGDMSSISEEVGFPCAGTFFVDDSVVNMASYSLSKDLKGGKNG